MIERVRGRIEDIILGSAGNDIGPMLFRVFYGVDNIERAQIAQVGSNLLEIRVVPFPGFTDSDRDLLISNLHRFVDPRIEAVVAVVLDIPRTASGKYRSIVNEYYDGTRERVPEKDIKMTNRS